MKYQTGKTFTNALGEPFKTQKGEEETFQTVAATALLADVDGSNQPTKASEKMKRFDLWIKIKQAEGEVELTSEEVSLLASAAEIFSTILYGQFKYFLDQRG